MIAVFAVNLFPLFFLLKNFFGEKGDCFLFVWLPVYL